jgi:hypothetical protein
MKKSEVTIGMVVRLTEDIARAEYFGPHHMFTPEYPGGYRTARAGEIGIVGAVDVPCPCINRSFICVDIVDDAGRWRARPYYNQVTAAAAGK